MKKHYLQYGKKQIHIRELDPSGNETGNPILCLHPSPYSGLFFETIMPMINKNRKIIAPDYLGYGSSSSIESPPSINDYAVSISEVLDQLGNYEKFELIGFHTGCLVANELCHLIPNNIVHTIMIDIPYFTGETQKGLLTQMSKPFALHEDLESLRKSWDFNIKNKIGKVNIERSFDLLVESLRSGNKDHFAFHAAFTYACEKQFKSNSKQINILATRSGLLDATHTASDILNNSEITDIEGITSNVFEEGAEIIAKHVLEILNAD
tara:strand:- start:184 stop:981 length:798 start_codon:yes stop_codon:yes gene_type:complete